MRLIEPNLVRVGATTATILGMVLLAVQAAEVPQVLPGTNLTTMAAIQEKWTNAPVPLLRQTAEAGDPHAQLLLGWRYFWGRGVESNQVEGVHWHQKAAENGLAEAQFRLGSIYDDGRGVATNHVLAQQWMTAAANQGLPKAQYYLGWIHEHRERNLAEAAEWYEQAANRGHTNAAYRLAKIYTDADRHDEAKWMKWLRKAAEMGHITAAEDLGLHLRYNRRDARPDPVEAAKWLRRAADAGRLRARCQLAYMLDQGEGMPADPAKAYQTLVQLSRLEVDEQTAQPLAGVYLRLGEMCEAGRGTPKDFAAAREWYLQAGDYYPAVPVRIGRFYELGQGVPQNDRMACEYYEGVFRSPDTQAAIEALLPLLNLYAQGRGLPRQPEDIPSRLVQAMRTPKPARETYLMGELYRKGILVSNDLAQATELYSLAASLGSPEAQTRIGQSWHSGVTGTADPAEAARWYQRAAVQGYAEAQYLFGQALSTGEGVPIDQVTALKWVFIAAGQGYPEAKKNLAQMESSTTPADREQARRLADAFRPQPEAGARPVMK